MYAAKNVPLTAFLTFYTVLQDGFTAAFAAAQNGHSKVLALLRDAGVNLNTPNKVPEPAIIAIIHKKA